MHPIKGNFFASGIFSFSMLNNKLCRPTTDMANRWFYCSVSSSAHRFRKCGPMMELTTLKWIIFFTNDTFQ
jgi:hypothetical protein